MAIKRLNPNLVRKFVSVSDEAIDHENSDVKEYVKTLDASHLKFKAEQVPTYFHVKNLSAEICAEITDSHYKFETFEAKEGVDVAPRVSMHGQTSMLLKYFKNAVVAIEENDKVVSIAAGKIPDDIPHDVIREIGGYALRAAQIRDSEKKR